MDVYGRDVSQSGKRACVSCVFSDFSYFNLPRDSVYCLRVIIRVHPGRREGVRERHDVTQCRKRLSFLLPKKKKATTKRCRVSERR